MRQVPQAHEKLGGVFQFNAGVAPASYLLMLLPSFSRSPAAPVLDTLSLPARSTKLTLLTFSPEF